MKRICLNVDQLEGRCMPALTTTGLIPGYAGEVQVVLGHFNNDILLDTAVVAKSGGSCRTMVIDGVTGETILNTITFGDDFRGGGTIATIQRRIGGTDHSVPDKLVVVPGPGGGPRVVEFSFDSSSGQMVMSASFFAPFPAEFRGGLTISSGDIDGDGIVEAMFLPGTGGAPLLRAVDMTTHETELSIYVGDPEDRSGDARFDSVGGTVQTNFGLAVVVQYGEVDQFNRVDTRVWRLDGIDITSLIRYTDPIQQSPG